MSSKIAVALFSSGVDAQNSKRNLFCLELALNCQWAQSAGFKFAYTRGGNIKPREKKEKTRGREKDGGGRKRECVGGREGEREEREGGERKERGRDRGRGRREGGRETERERERQTNTY